MKIRFKSEQAMNEFASLSLGYSNHNKNLATRMGMKEFEVYTNPMDEWWDTPDGDFTISVENESKYFDIVGI